MFFSIVFYLLYFMNKLKYFSFELDYCNFSDSLGNFYSFVDKNLVLNVRYYVFLTSDDCNRYFYNLTNPKIGMREFILSDSDLSSVNEFLRSIDVLRKDWFFSVYDLCDCNKETVHCFNKVKLYFIRVPVDSCIDMDVIIRILFDYYNIENLIDDFTEGWYMEEDLEEEDDEDDLIDEDVDKDNDSSSELLRMFDLFKDVINYVNVKLYFVYSKMVEGYNAFISFVYLFYVKGFNLKWLLNCLSKFNFKRFLYNLKKYRDP